MNDQEIIKLIKDGDPSQFGLLYDRYIKKIYTFVYYKTHHKETAEDLSSKCFMKALMNISIFEDSKGTFKAWLYQIARNTVIDHYRTHKTDANIEDVWDLNSGEDLISDTDVKLRLEKVKEYMHNLKPREREIIMLRVWEGMSHQEIAEVLGKTEDSVKMAYSRAIKALRREMPLAVFTAFMLSGTIFK